MVIVSSQCVRVFRTLILLFLVLSLSIPRGVFTLVSSVPSIIEHYNHHREVIGNVSLIDFINQHISESNHPEFEKQHPDHHKLPFNQHIPGSGYFTTYLPQVNTVDFTCVAALPVSIAVSRTEQFFSSDVSGKIWQPPKHS